MQAASLRSSHLAGLSRWALAALLALVFVACGGGGGGGGGGGSDFGVRVLHGSIDSAPLDLISSATSSVVVSQAVFASSGPYRALKAGQQIVSLTKAFNSSDVLASFPLNYQEGARYSVLFFGDHASVGISSALIVDEVPAGEAGSYVRVVNGMTGAAALDVTAGASSVETVGFGAAGAYLPVQPGQVSITARRASDGRLATSTVVSAQEGRSYTLLVAGELGYYVKGVVFTDN